MTMQQIISALFTILFLNLDNVLCTSKTQRHEECNVKESYTHSFGLGKDNAFNLSFLITPEDKMSNLSIHISFVDREVYLDNDLLILKFNNGKIQRKRNGERKNIDVIMKNNIPFGWNSVAITSNDKGLEVGNFYTITDLEYQIHDITISAKYLTNCTKRTPMWEIKNSDQISIPLSEFSIVDMRIISDKPFHPEIILYTLVIPLSFDEELVIKNSSKPISRGDYRILVAKNSSMVSMYTTQENEIYKLLMKVNINEEHVIMKVGTFSGIFFLILDPFLEDLHKKDSTIEDQPYNGKDDATSSTVWLPVGLTLVIVILFVVIIFLMKRHTIWPLNDKIDDLEGGDSNTPLLQKESIKNIIKSKHTEPHGESNLQIYPHKREVYQIKLESDKKDDNSKKLGDLDTENPRKVILVIGKTGSGKSSFINAMANNIYGVEFEDSFRFKLIDDMDVLNESGINNTDNITSYCIPYMFGIKHNCNYIFIDTPGFGDARGIEEDKKWNEKFKKFLSNSDIKMVDAVCIVINASTTRLTEMQKYIFAGLFSMFGKDIERNIYAIISHSDGSQTSIPMLFEESDLKYSFAYDFNSDGIYNDSETDSASTQKVQNYFKENWEMNMKSLDALFEKLMKTTAVSLYLTAVVLEENEDIRKLTDEILKLSAKEHDATDKEKQDIQSKIGQNQSRLIIKLDEAQKLTGRLENIPCHKNPLVINDYIDMIIKCEKDVEKISNLQKHKERNIRFQKLLKENKSSKKYTERNLVEKSEKIL